MKNIMKRCVLTCLVAAFAVSGFGCNKKPNDENRPAETISLENTKQDLTFSYKQGPAVDATESAENSEKADESTAESKQEYEDVTEFVDVTDEAGQPVTDANGVKQTEVVVVGTRPVSGSGNDSSRVDDGNDDSSTADGNSGGNAGSYTPSYDTCKAYWLDMSKAEDYVFNGEFLIITFQVNEDIPDGNYPVTIAATDIASWDLVTYDPVIINGEVSVNSTPTEQQTAGSDFTLKVNSTEAKQGDVATVVVDLSNNPGFVGFVVDIQYDANAFTILDATGGKDFNNTIGTV